MTEAVMTEEKKKFAGFQARYAGKCSVCHLPINVGDMVNWDRSSKGVVWHFPCDEKREALPPTPKASGAVPAGALDGLAALLAPIIAPMVTPSIDKSEVLDLIIQEVEKRVSPTISVELKRPDGSLEKLETVHPNFAELLELINIGENVYLWGPPGGGKSTAAYQAYQALKLPHWGLISLNPQSPASLLIGYMDAQGRYVRTTFRDCYEHGGVFFIDELDNSSAALITTLNSALENHHCAFPDGVVTRHKDFICVAAGNTNLKGASAAFPERRPQDAASVERFICIPWLYDEALEKKLTLAVNKEGGEWLAWIRQVRRYGEKNFPRLVVSPRASIRGAKLLGRDAFKGKFARVAELVLFKGTDQDTVDKILTACPLPVA